MDGQSAGNICSNSTCAEDRRRRYTFLPRFPTFGPDASSKGQQRSEDGSGDRIGDPQTSQSGRRHEDAPAFSKAVSAAALSGYETLYRAHGGRMKSIALHLLGNTSDAEDAVQEAFLKIYRGIRGFAGQASLSTWIFRILINTCRDIGRRRKRNPEQTASAGNCIRAAAKHSAEAGARKGAWSDPGQSQAGVPACLRSKAYVTPRSQRSSRCRKGRRGLGCLKPRKGCSVC